MKDKNFLAFLAFIDYLSIEKSQLSMKARNFLAFMDYLSIQNSQLSMKAWIYFLAFLAFQENTLLGFLEISRLSWLSGIKFLKTKPGKARRAWATLAFPGFSVEFFARVNMDTKGTRQSVCIIQVSVLIEFSRKIVPVTRFNDTKAKANMCFLLQQVPVKQTLRSFITVSD